MPPKRAKPKTPPCAYALTFASRQEVLAHWQHLVSPSAERAGPAGELSRDFRMAYAPGNGWVYIVALATPQDTEALAALSCEFVDAHASLFGDDYSGVAPSVWRQYLGFPTEESCGQARGAGNG